jgi:SAM-dependent methyltransferase
MTLSLMSRLYRWVDPSLNYGREAITELVAACGRADTILDVAAGTGADLTNAQAMFPSARLIAFDFVASHLHMLEGKGAECHALDLERSEFPVAPGSVDIVIANQILEHTKDVFWILDQITRSLRDGGYLIVGVPNLASLHNRVLLAFGRQPTPIKTASAHVRGFTRADLLDFLESCYPGGFELLAYRGANFYPFPPALARPLARALPSLAWGNMYLFRKRRPYDGEFIRYPSAMQLETNFFVGPKAG